LTLRGETKDESDQQAVVAVIDRFVNARNRHDAKAFAAVFAEDADFTNWRGEGASGRSKIEDLHGPMFATISKDSHQRYTAIKTRLIRPDGGCRCPLGDDGCNGCSGKSAARSSRFVEFHSGEKCRAVANRGHAQPGLDSAPTLDFA
jgi:hypothetical protein